MSIYQKSVLNKHLKNLDENIVNDAWQAFTKHFHNPTIQENIRNSKEEQYQGEFLIDLFVKVLGYTKNPNPNFNLTTELKNVKGAKKSDGAILKDDNAIAVIELKGMNTTDLGKVENQAFGYKNNQPHCTYVVISNFEKLRFYIDNAIDFLEFNLFKLTREQFNLLWLCLAKDHILNDLPKQIKNESLTIEEEVTKKLYKDYSLFRNELFNSITESNPKHDKLTLFKKTQKLLDRFLFIFFAEDRLLLPPNSIRLIMEQWKALQELDEYQPLYHRFKKYFGYLNTGFKGKKHDIFAYNGGLFAPDELLDGINIDDDILYKHTLKLSDYDFESEISVNILGHIFEHSLSEIEEIQAELNGETLDKKTSKRKKDGVFYTPKYITKYIIENTVGKLCEEQKNEIGIKEDDYNKDRKGRKKATLKRLNEQLENYRNWLLQLTICDPACGSGAFLNQALEFLIAEHTYIDELQAKLLGGSFVFPNVENAILENNLYGVDINNESVEIAKLSLWLRTAQKGRKLTSLNNNIKCGNSLIDDVEVAGDKAFNWEKEFPHVFENGGFDVVVGNPPYVDIKGLEPTIVKILFENYSTSENRINLYSIFIEKSYSLLRENGYFSFINPNSILVNSSYTKIRKLLIDDITTIIKLPDDVFPDAKVETIIFEFKKGGGSEFVNTLVYPKELKINFIDKSKLKIQNKKFWKQFKRLNYNIYVSDKDISLLQKCENSSVYLENVADFTLGITPYDKYKGHSQETIKNRLFHSTKKNDETYKPLISGSNINRHYVGSYIGEYIKYGDWLGAMREERFFIEPRIIVRQIVSGKPPRIYAGYTEQPYYFTQIGFGIIPKPKLDVKYLLSLINSALITYYHKYKFLDLEKELFQKILIANCKQFPIKLIDVTNQEIFSNKVDVIIKFSNELDKKKSKFNNRMLTNLEIEKLSKKLASFYEYDFKTFVAELKKKKVKLSLVQQDEWEEYFNAYKGEINDLQTQINATDKEIDKMVYELYGLTDEEIKIVEASV